MHKRFILERGAGHDGYASGGVPVTGTLPELGQSQSAGLRPSKWHFAGTWAARHDPRTISQLIKDSLLWAWRRRSGVGAGIGVELALVLSALKALATGGQVGPERSFVNCVDAADLRIPTPKSSKSPRSRHALAVPSPQARASWSKSRRRFEGCTVAACGRFGQQQRRQNKPIRLVCSRGVVRGRPASGITRLRAPSRWKTKHAKPSRRATEAAHL